MRYHKVKKKIATKRVYYICNKECNKKNVCNNVIFSVLNLKNVKIDTFIGYYF